jgi:hypothetical protein
MAVQNAEKSCFRSGQNSPCYQEVIDVPSIFAHVFANKVPALLARKSRGPLGRWFPRTQSSPISRDGFHLHFFKQRDGFVQRAILKARLLSMIKDVIAR